MNVTITFPLEHADESGTLFSKECVDKMVQDFRSVPVYASGASIGRTTGCERVDDGVSVSIELNEQKLRLHRDHSAASKK